MKVTGFLFVPKYSRALLSARSFMSQAGNLCSSANVELEQSRAMGPRYLLGAVAAALIIKLHSLIRAPFSDSRKHALV